MDFSYLKEMLDGLIAEGSTPSVDCSVYKEHEEIFRYNSGFKDIESNTKIKGDELYIIFSMTKMLTCTCALQLLEKGAFSMDDPLYKYIPEFSRMKISDEEYDALCSGIVETGKIMGGVARATHTGYAENHITIRHLFTMTAGLDYNLKAEGILKSINQGRTSTIEIIRALSDTVLGFEPGTRYRYSLCHDVLGALIEIWSGMRFSDYMRENVFEPLGMKDTFFTVPKDEDKLARFASIYIYNGAGKFNKVQQRCAYNLTDDYESGGAGLVSTTDDYALFLDALANGGVGKSGNRILLQDTIELMRTNQLKDRQREDFEKERPGYGYGFGVRVHMQPEKSSGLSPVGEFGWGGAAGGYSLVDPQNKVSMTYFQHMFGWDMTLQGRLRDALYRSLAE